MNRRSTWTVVMAGALSAVLLGGVGCSAVEGIDIGTQDSDPAAAAAAQSAVLTGLRVATFDEACGTVDWACEIEKIDAESAYVVRVDSTVGESRWEPAGRGARAIMAYLGDDPATSDVTSVKYVGATGTVLDTANKVTYRIGDCALPCGAPSGR